MAGEWEDAPAGWEDAPVKADSARPSKPNFFDWYRGSLNDVGRGMLTAGPYGAAVAAGKEALKGIDELKKSEKEEREIQIQHLSILEAINKNLLDFLSFVQKRDSSN